MNRFLLLTLALLLGGCASGQGKPKLPYDAWFVGLGAPSYMEVWIESVDVIDRRGLVFERVYEGISAIQTPPNNKGKPAGWPKRVGGGKGKNLPGIDLPEIIFVRWQSLVEPQTYRATLEVPKSARNLMLREQRIDCPMGGWQSAYRNTVVIGLAPGGIAKLWVSGPCFKGTEILRVQAEIEPKGPYQGLSKGRHRSLKPAAKAYIEQHGIPYGSW